MVITNNIQIEVAKISDEWEDVALSDMAELIKDGYKPTGYDNFVYIGLEHIDQQSLSLNSIGHSTEVESNKFVFQSGDILFGKLRPYFRKVYRPHFSGVCSTDIWVVRSKNGTDQGFLFYLMANQDFIDLASLGSSGTRMPRADWEHLKDTVWKKPPLIEQQAIAKILSGLDEKIELNHRMNKTLESIAQALFKRWFVDFEFPGHEKTKFVDSLPEGWEIGKLKDILNHSREAIRPLNDSQGTYFHYSLPAYDSGLLPVQETGKEILSNKFKVKKYSILVSKLNPRIPRIWTIGDVDENYSICSTEFQVFIPKEQFYYSYVALFFSLQSTKDLMMGKATGTSSSHQRVRPEDLLDIDVVVPHKDVLNNFELLMSSNFQKRSLNLKQSQYLQQIRDCLLPKLISGKIIIKETGKI